MARKPVTLPRLELPPIPDFWGQRQPGVEAARTGIDPVVAPIELPETPLFYVSDPDGSAPHFPRPGIWRT